MPPTNDAPPPDSANSLTPPVPPRRGRPAGSRSVRPAVVTVPTSRCPKCDGTERAKYSRTLETPHAGRAPDGRPFTHVVRRWTRCLTCGQARIDRTYENRTADPEADASEGLSRAA